MKVRHSAGIYFAFQAVAVAIWWLVLLFIPSSRIYFQMGSDSSNATLLAFWLPDLFLLAAGSAIAGALCFLNSKLLPLAMWFVCGTIAYATFYCLAFALLTDTGWLGVTMMMPATLWSGVFSLALSPVEMFRQAKPAKTNWILIKTTTQIVVVWTLILFIFPSFIIQLEDKLGISRFTFPLQKLLAVIFFIGISLLGLSSAYLMSKIGKGTPLPLDAARNLVIQGAYAYVRNPMAISGVGQGLAVGLYLGSPLVLLYALMGGLIWQLVFRPLEEADLVAHFGVDYEKYRGAVRCWIPLLKPFKPE
jgi:protein-S-isoprenylcysteine O-methyltransferase Ste14